jgi:hypothetical protein
MADIDPVLRQLVAVGNAAEESIPLTLYLPSGRLWGHTTSHYDFGHRATFEVEQQSEAKSTAAPEIDPDYVHLIVREASNMLDDDGSTAAVRVRQADVVAWYVG